MVTIIGAGLAKGQLTLASAECLRSAPRVLLHTAQCGCAEWLTENGIAFEALDALYEASEDFDEHIDLVVDAVTEAAQHSDIAYVVLDVRDRTVAALARSGMSSGMKTRVLAGPPLEGTLTALADGECRMLSASDWEEMHASAHEACLIRELNDWSLAAELKLKLTEVYPEETEVTLLYGDGDIKTLPLYRLDFESPAVFDHRTALFIPAQSDITLLERYDYDHLGTIVKKLCSPTGCPWDRVQTHETLRTYMLEETYEVIDAIEAGDMTHLCEELGDMLFQVAFHAEIARKHGEFEPLDITTGICEKMIRRHSHIFGEDNAQDADAVGDLWQKNKKAARGFTTQTEVLRDIARSLPATMRAVKTLKRSADVGMCNEIAEVTRKLLIDYLQKPIESEADLGRLLLLFCDLARLAKLDPELALNGATDRFIDRFEKAERAGLNRAQWSEVLGVEP